MYFQGHERRRVVGNRVVRKRERHSGDYVDTEFNIPTIKDPETRNELKKLNRTLRVSNVFSHLSVILKNLTLIVLKPSTNLNF